MSWKLEVVGTDDDPRVCLTISENIFDEASIHPTPEQARVLAKELMDMADEAETVPMLSEEDVGALWVMLCTPDPNRTELKDRLRAMRKKRGS